MSNTNSQNYESERYILEGVDNISLFIFAIIASYIFYIIYIILMEFLKKKQDLNRRIQDIDNIPEINENPERNEDDCPICSDVLHVNSCQLDCNHKYCCKCIMDYYETTRPYIKCPMCRANIRLINVLNFDRSPESRKYVEMIAIFNHENLNGYNYVILNFCFIY